MTGVFDKLIYYLGFPFVRYALTAGILIALCSSFLGVILVLKRYSFISDGLSHVAFGAIAIAAAMNLSNRLILVLPATIICAVLLLNTGRYTILKGDAAIALISVSALAIGYLILNIFSRSANLAGDVCSTLFGSASILTLSQTDVWICAILSITVISLFLLFYHKIFAVTFDENFATATGINAKMYNLFLAIIIAVVVVVAMNLVGALLISALVIFPALCAMRVYKCFKAVTICSVIVSTVCAALGILLSIISGTPAGATIVVVYIAVFLVFCLIGHITRTIKH